MSKVLLEQIRSLTLYKGELTEAKRLPPIQQLKCVGKVCKLYQPDVVRCHNNGGSGTDIDWTCEADLPEKLRFGRVDVSCEGWSRPGDPYVLKGSCGLEYRLINIGENGSNARLLGDTPWYDWFEKAFLWLAILLAIYFFFGSYIRQFFSWARRSLGFGSSSSSSRPGGNGGGGGGGWFSSGHNRGPSRRPPSNYPPPPPYSAYPPKSHSRPHSDSSSTGSSRPGFWSGFGLGNLTGWGAGRFFNGRNNTQPRHRDAHANPTTQEYDWERERLGRRTGGLFGSSSWSVPRGTSFTSDSTPRSQPSARTAARSNTDDRGEGPSNLGRMRKSTGYGVTNVR